MAGGGGGGLALDRPGMGAAGRGEAGGPRARPAPLAPLALLALALLALALELLAARRGRRGRVPQAGAQGPPRGASEAVWLPSTFCASGGSPQDGFGGATGGRAAGWLSGALSARARARGGVRFISIVDFESLADEQGTSSVCRLAHELGESLGVRVLSEWVGFGGKVRENLSVLRTDPMLEKELVVLIDAFDTFNVRYRGDPREFQAAFAGFGADVVISGERGIRDLDFNPLEQEIPPIVTWWRGDFQAGGPLRDSRPPDRFAAGGSTPWPTQANAGFLAGLGKDLEMFLSALLDWARPPNTHLDSYHWLWDDQTALQLFLRAGAPGFSGTWVLDDHSTLVHTCAYDKPENFVVDADNQQISYRVAGYGAPDRAPDRTLNPFFFHGAGNSAKGACGHVFSVARSWQDGGKGHG